MIAWWICGRRLQSELNVVMCRLESIFTYLIWLLPCSCLEIKEKEDGDQKVLGNCIYVSLPCYCTCSR